MRKVTQETATDPAKIKNKVNTNIKSKIKEKRFGEVILVVF